MQQNDAKSQLKDIEPKKKELLMDLVKSVGIDISDWANTKGGKKRAASNPKYCYNWSFIGPGKVVVLNLWYEHLKEENGIVYTLIDRPKKSTKK